MPEGSTGFKAFAEGLAQTTQGIPQILMMMQEMKQRREQQEEQKRQFDVTREDALAREKRETGEQRAFDIKQRSFDREIADLEAKGRIAKAIGELGPRGFGQEDISRVREAGTERTELNIPNPAAGFGLGGAIQTIMSRPSEVGAQTAIAGLGQSQREKDLDALQIREITANIASREKAGGYDWDRIADQYQNAREGVTGEGFSADRKALAQVLGLHPGSSEEIGDGIFAILDQTPKDIALDFLEQSAGPDGTFDLVTASEAAIQELSDEGWSIEAIQRVQNSLIKAFEEAEEAEKIAAEAGPEGLFAAGGDDKITDILFNMFGRTLFPSVGRAERGERESAKRLAGILEGKK